MTRREIAFLLIAVGFRLTLAMITGYGWDAGITIASHSSTHTSRLMQTTIALPIMDSCRKCYEQAS